jgi:hypothetical protein
VGTLAARGYVDQGNLCKDPDLNVAIIVTIHEQWVDINCWIDGGSNGFGSNWWNSTRVDVVLCSARPGSRRGHLVPHTVAVLPHRGQWCPAAADRRDRDRRGPIGEVA